MHRIILIVSLIPGMLALSTVATFSLFLSVSLTRSRSHSHSLSAAFHIQSPPFDIHSQIFKVCLFILHFRPFFLICFYEKNITLYSVFLNVYEFDFATSFIFLIFYHCSFICLKSIHVFLCRWGCGIYAIFT